mmetsp:Transcript_11671/g.32321  ORF Transcript_11671/g.32321 Transcript_11671/m.32321 type:complete len:230 (+) Transcript_11671:138-827(+)
MVPQEQQQQQQQQPPQLNIAPHTALELHEEQRKDRVLRKFLKTTTSNTNNTMMMSPDSDHTATTLDSSDSMIDKSQFSVQTVDETNVVCSKSGQQVYIPGSLRQVTMEYYYNNQKQLRQDDAKNNNNPETSAFERLRQNCFWPQTMRDDWYEFAMKQDKVNAKSHSNDKPKKASRRHESRLRGSESRQRNESRLRGSESKQHRSSLNSTTSAAAAKNKFHQKAHRRSSC